MSIGKSNKYKKQPRTTNRASLNKTGKNGKLSGEKDFENGCSCGGAKEHDQVNCTGLLNKNSRLIQISCDKRQLRQKSRPYNG